MPLLEPLLIGHGLKQMIYIVRVVPLATQVHIAVADGCRVAPLGHSNLALHVLIPGGPGLLSEQLLDAELVAVVPKVYLLL